MKIVEIFPTIQGEGPRLGKPSIFVRVGGCNLRCQFKGEACDTPYAVFTSKELDKKNPKLKYGYTTWMDYSTQELIYELAHYNPNINHIVFTGGEPFLYKNEIFEIIKELHLFTFEIETNGTILCNPSLKDYTNVFFNISVKLSSSNQEKAFENKRINEAALRSFSKFNSIYKFVISNPENDLNEIRKILSINNLPVYVMPEGTSRQQVIKNSQKTIDLALNNNFTFTPREHINIWNTKKGV